MSRGGPDKDQRVRRLYDSIATAVFSNYARQNLDESQMDFLLSLLDAVCYRRIDDDFVEIAGKCMKSGMGEDPEADFFEMLVRTDLEDPESVRAHYRIMRHWLDIHGGAD